MTETLSAAAVETDAVVIGAGPAGLFQVFQLGLQGIHAHVVDALPHAGGQCVELYGEKPIYDIPGVPVCTGRELAALLLRQIEPFNAHWHLNALVSGLTPQADGRFLVETTQGAQLLARNIFIAAGVGAFVPRTLKVEGIDKFVGTQVFYQQLPPSAPVEALTQVVVHGGDEAAVVQALAMARRDPANGTASPVTLLHRRDVFQASEATLAELSALRDSGRVRTVVGQITGMNAADGRLQSLELIGPDGEPQTLPVDLLVAVLGVSPRLGPVAEWSLAMERKQLVVDTESFCTSVPGIYAVGDIVTYPGKRKLILCGFHEATLAAFGAAQRLSNAPVPTQYTTTSTQLLARLGVEPPAPRTAHRA